MLKTWRVILGEMNAKLLQGLFQKQGIEKPKNIKELVDITACGFEPKS